MKKDYVSNQKSLTYKFIGAYPISIVSMPISYEQSQLLKCTVSFTYLRYVMNPSNEPNEVIADSAILQAPPESGSQNTSYPDNLVGNTSGEDQRFIPTDSRSGFRGDGKNLFYFQMDHPFAMLMEI